jgi:predicted CoA-binding protein
MNGSGRVVAIIGASNDRRKFGNRAVRAYLRQGYTVRPVNPHETEVEGVPAFPSIADVPERVDVVSLYVPPDVGERLIDEIAARRPAELWVNPGADSPALLARARALGLEPIVACSIMGIGERAV